MFAAEHRIEARSHFQGDQLNGGSAWLCWPLESRAANPRRKAKLNDNQRAEAIKRMPVARAAGPSPGVFTYTKPPHKVRVSHFPQRLSRQSAHLFVHWRLGMTGTFA
jgi:hypothetical protein